MAQERQYLKNTFPDGIALETAFIAPTTLTQLEAAVEEAVASGSWTDVAPLLPSVLTPADAAALLSLVPALSAGAHTTKGGHTSAAGGGGGGGGKGAKGGAGAGAGAAGGQQGGSAPVVVAVTCVVSPALVSEMNEMMDEPGWWVVWQEGHQDFDLKFFVVYILDFVMVLDLWRSLVGSRHHWGTITGRSHRLMRPGLCITQTHSNSPIRPLPKWRMGTSALPSPRFSICFLVTLFFSISLSHFHCHLHSLQVSSLKEGVEAEARQGAEKALMERKAAPAAPKAAAPQVCRPCMYFGAPCVCVGPVSVGWRACVCVCVQRATYRFGCCPPPPPAPQAAQKREEEDEEEWGTSKKGGKGGAKGKAGKVRC